MANAEQEAKVLTGGCQCGAVRFAVGAPLGEASVCYCRMCQKATGGPFGLFVRVDRTKLEWTRGTPKRFTSSNIARRGFCADCGTPLFWEYDNGIDLTVASFDEAGDIEPTTQLCIAQRFPWLLRMTTLRVRDLNSDAEYSEFMKSVVSFQHPDHE
jgi:hypothetical protein